MHPMDAVARLLPVYQPVYAAKLGPLDDWEISEWRWVRDLPLGHAQELACELAQAALATQGVPAVQVEAPPTRSVLRLSEQCSLEIALGVRESGRWRTAAYPFPLRSPLPDTTHCLLFGLAPEGAVWWLLHRKDMEPPEDQHETARRGWSVGEGGPWLLLVDGEQGDGWIENWPHGDLERACRLLRFAAQGKLQPGMKPEEEVP